MNREGTRGCSGGSACPPGSPRRHRCGEEGASSVEYGLLITGIAALIVAAVFTFGGGVTHLFQDTCDRVASQTSDSC